MVALRLLWHSVLDGVFLLSTRYNSQINKNNNDDDDDDDDGDDDDDDDDDDNYNNNEMQ